MIEIIGAEGKISNIEVFLKKTQEFSKKNNIKIQSFDAELIYGKDHLTSSYNHAKRAFENKTNTSPDIEMELLLYSSGERQLKKAIPKMGIKKEKTKIIFIFIDNKIDKKVIKDFLKILNLNRNDKVIEGNINTLKKFGIKDNEIKTVNKEKYGDLILEKVAMVDIIK